MHLSRIIVLFVLMLSGLGLQSCSSDDEAKDGNLPAALKSLDASCQIVGFPSPSDVSFATFLIWKDHTEKRAKKRFWNPLADKLCQFLFCCEGNSFQELFQILAGRYPA